MYTTLTSAAIALLACASLGRAGTASVSNACGYDVYLWSVTSGSASMQTLAAGSGSYSEAYREAGDGGVSIKMSNDTSQESVTQFEYTLEGSSLWYDLSNINGYPFMEGGVSLSPSMSSCPPVSCPAGESQCGQVYNAPDDNEATKGCTSDCDLHLTLCSGGSSKRAVEIETREPHSHGHRRHVPPQARALLRL